jgi:hypothetical protein
MHMTDQKNIQVLTESELVDIRGESDAGAFGAMYALALGAGALTGPISLIFLGGAALCGGIVLYGR